MKKHIQLPQKIHFSSNMVFPLHLVHFISAVNDHKERFNNGVNSTEIFLIGGIFLRIFIMFTITSLIGQVNKLLPERTLVSILVNPVRLVLDGFREVFSFL